MTLGYDFKSDTQKAAEAYTTREGQRLENIYDQLAIEGGKNEELHSQVRTRTDGSKYIELPFGMSDAQGANILARKAEQEQEAFAHVQRAKYKPWDGAVALKKVLTDLFGAALTPSKGDNGAVEVPIDAYGGTMSIPLGSLELQWRNKQITIALGSYQDEEYGECFQAVYYGIELYRYELIGLANRVSKYLQEHSIYKGKSIKFSVRRQMPDFHDPFVTKPEHVCLSERVEGILERNFYGKLRTIEQHREAGLKVTESLLLEGDFGTGKTITTNVMAQKANEVGFTAIFSRAGEDNIEEVRAFAKLYAPAIIFIEDADEIVDKVGSDLSTVLEAFDGASTKGAEIGVVMTTNHYDKFPESMRRAGRIDTIVHFGSWDAHAFEKSVNAHFPAEEIGDVDFEAVAEAMDGFKPAFVITTWSKTRSAAIVRTGKPFQPLVTEDFLATALEVREHHDEFEEAKGFEKVDTYYQTQSAFAQEAVAKVMDGATFEDGALRVATK